MKYLLLLAVLVVAYLLWRNARLAQRREGTKPSGTSRATRAPQAMVACAHCGVHLPGPDALPGRDGRVYCGAEHRLRGERG